ncbi:pentatricopeptide repeat-containing protein At3g62890-like [Humulus lupulus]|uniref:pentatricopeptide repeat-containing protein At3g62890-like n=1 Tax=Humulus lupulus TaxID=3486 RepID=UPI002B413253|nr:pentatricopeptide repeat-containing protein At3g62890-like [Humulus lupulus]
MAAAIPTVLSSFSLPTQEPTKNHISNPAPGASCVVSLLKSCSNIREFTPLHAHLITTNLIHDPITASHVLRFFVSIENLCYAHRVFSQTQEPETIIWNTLIQNYLKNNFPKQVFSTYSHMVTQGVPLDISTFHFLIHACCKTLAFQRGTEVHGRVLKSGMGRNKSLNNNLMALYSKCGKLDEVQQVFKKMPHRDMISWNTMISCYVQMGIPGKALNLFREMQVDGVAADDITMISLLSACSKLRDLETGEKLHLYIKRNDLEIGGNLLNCLVNMYIECGRMEKAHEIVTRSKTGNDVALWTSLVGGYMKSKKIHAARCVFDHITEKSLISWMTMISGYVQGGYYNESLELFREMRLENVMADEVLLGTALSACTHVEDCKLGKSIQSLAVRCGIMAEGLLGNALIHFYAKCGKPKEAQLIFEQLPNKSNASWNSMLDAFCRNGELENAKLFFEKIPNKDIISWNTMINSSSKYNQPGEVFKLFREMQSSAIRPNKLTLISVLSSCASVGALKHGIWVHVYIEKNHIQIDNRLGTALIDMYGKCGSVKKAQELFSDLTDKNVHVWTAMIAAHAMEGQTSKAFDLYMEMEVTGIKPDHITFIALLSACSHGGLVNEGFSYFNEMSTAYNITPNLQHFGCMADLLGRVGQLDRALKFIKTMPVKPDISMWSSLLRACKSHQNVELAEYAFQQLIELDPVNDAAYALLSNTYAKAGRWDDVSHTRKKLFDLGVRKTPGCSLIEEEGVVHEFIAADFSSPHSSKIYSFLDEMKGRFEKIGLQETSAHHSERLAVAFGLINSSGRTLIRVVNNLRMCEDCHSAMKLLSQAFNREIVIRDNYRFHRFVDGNCSCKDNW